jgi:hypothetical protein
VTESEIIIDYLDPNGLPKVHTVKAECSPEYFSDEVQEAVDTISKDGFFLVMEEARYVWITPNAVLRVSFNLTETEDGS